MDFGGGGWGRRWCWGISFVSWGMRLCCGGSLGAGLNVSGASSVGEDDSGGGDIHNADCFVVV